MKKNKLTPLDELRREKAIVKRECAESEDRLAGQWLYFSDNAGSLIFHSVVNVVLRQFGFGHKAKSREEEDDSNSGGGVMHGLLSSLKAYYPVLLEILQPVLLGFVVKKIKSAFTSKKKKKRKYYYDDED
ncbi:hypothetical protein [Prevotella sp. 10(H)]|uniref:hypothetical protein n=1 Tax=Prevotella sp. 10(H) TaxID=1158294 RepID=UPI0004A7770F|nr:hypothetical protein [Prevotella sp. 10(H)]